MKCYQLCIRKYKYFTYSLSLAFVSSKCPNIKNELTTFVGLAGD